MVWIGLIILDFQPYFSFPLRLFLLWVISFYTLPERICESEKLANQRPMYTAMFPYCSKKRSYGEGDLCQRSEAKLLYKSCPSLTQSVKYNNSYFLKYSNFSYWKKKIIFWDKSWIWIRDWIIIRIRGSASLVYICFQLHGTYIRW